MDPEFVKALDVIQDGVFQKGKRNVSEDFYKWYEETGRHHPEHTEILVAG